MKEKSKSFKVRVPQHSHCLVCNAVIPVNKTFCSKECEEKYVLVNKRKKRLETMYFAIGMAAILLFSAILRFI